MKPQWVQALSRRPQGMVIAGACVTFAAIAYIPISELKIEYDCLINIWLVVVIVIDGGYREYDGILEV